MRREVIVRVARDLSRESYVDYVTRNVTKWKSEEIVSSLSRYLYPKRSGSYGCDPASLKSQTSLKDNVAKATSQPVQNV